MQNRITQLFNIQYPIIQAGMVWCSGWRLASAVSNAGGLGLIGAGSMNADVLREHIQKCKQATDKPFGVNLPLLYAHIDQHIDVLLTEEVKIVFTSAGNPATYTSKLKAAGITVVHVVSSTKFALKAPFMFIIKKFVYLKYTSGNKLMKMPKASHLPDPNFEFNFVVERFEIRLSDLEFLGKVIH